MGGGTGQFQCDKSTKIGFVGRMDVSGRCRQGGKARLGAGSVDTLGDLV